MTDLKKYAEKKMGEWKKNTKANQKYKRELRAKVKVAQQKAYAEESVKQAQARARRKARVQYSPKARQGYLDQSVSPLMESIAFGNKPKQQSHKKSPGKKKGKGKKKSSGRRKSQPSRPLQPGPQNSIPDLLWKY